MLQTINITEYREKYPEETANMSDEDLQKLLDLFYAMSDVTIPYSIKHYEASCNLVSESIK